MFTKSIAFNVFKLSSLLLLSIPCAQAQTPNTTIQLDTILARGPQEAAVRWQDVLTELQRAPLATQKAMLSRPESVQQVVNNVLLRRAVAAQAIQNKLDADPAVATALQQARERLLAEAQLLNIDAHNTPDPAVLEAAVTEAYKANATRFDVPAQAHARHILLDSKAPDALSKSQQLLAQLRAGASFDELAKANSLDTGSAAKGGDLGFFPAGKMVQVFEDAVNALAKPGDLSEPVLSEFGYHIIRLEERRSKTRIPLAEVHDQLAAETLTAIRNAARQAELQKLSKDFVFDEAVIKSAAQSVAP